MTLELTFTKCQNVFHKGEGMDHSMCGYLQRRTTEELENILISYMGQTVSELNKEVVRMTIDILAERKVYLPEEYLEIVRDYLEKS